MIPASYLFKQVYNQSWNEPEAPAMTETNRRFLDGLSIPLAAAVIALFAHRPATSNQRFGHPAYD
ncbi:hypothetical protein SAMN05428969_1587 [Devosia sp. YR412]|uniref:hypothetical protein n=1 Tax=Devosia sp. YR412 TaxID=1881030 RepID=UPI0008B346F2|nr:hypothetical protein [Devosia sp. YR412]SEQ02404.1 hypothetical protein SAMN05428969_1587 [Devosia sp. YR412]